MNRAAKLIIIGSVVAAMSVVGTMLSFAAWTVPNGKAKLVADVAKMPRGVTPSAAKQGSTAVVSWSAQEIAPGVRMDRYVVTAHSVDTPPLPDVTHAVAAGGGGTESVTFVAGEVAGGKWYWTVVPQYRLWVGAESGKSQRLIFPAAPVARTVGDPAGAPPAAAPAPAAATVTPGATTTTSPAATTSPSPESTPTGARTSAPRTTAPEAPPPDEPTPSSALPPNPAEPTATGSARVDVPE